MSETKTLFLPDGGLYIGELNSAGRPESTEASCAWPDGRSYIGAWANGEMCGIGTLYNRGKAVKYGYWWRGELLHDFNAVNSNQQPANPQPSGQQPSNPQSSGQHPSNQQPSNPQSSGQQPSNPHPSGEQPYKPRPKNRNKITALLIGNNDYPSSPLNNCIKDIEAIASKLRLMNVDVEVLRNATKRRMIDAIYALGSKDTSYDHVMFFFSGHGMTNQGRHYITSVDESYSDKAPLSIEELDEFLSKTQYKNIMLVSDACSVIVAGDGNSDMVVSAGRTLMAFSSCLGAVAHDGIPSEHSPFAFGLLQYLTQPISVVQMFQETNKFAMTYATDHSFYQQPMLIISPYFPIDFKLFRE